MSIRNKLFALLLFVLFANVFFFAKLGPLALALILAAMFIYVYALFGGERNQFNRRIIGFAAILFTIPLVTTLYAGSEIRQVVAFFFAIGSLSYVSYILMKQYVPGGILESVLSIPGAVVEYIGGGLSFVKKVIYGKVDDAIGVLSKDHVRSSMGRSIATGLIISLPVVAILVSLLSNADPIFASYVRTIFSEEFLSKLTGRIILSGVLVVFLLPTVLMRSRNVYRSPFSFLMQSDWSKEVSVVLLMVSIVLLSFLAIQWPYVFASVVNETSLSTYGVATYSEYVQKGFAELVNVAVIVFALSWVAVIAQRGVTKEKLSRVLLILHMVIIGEFSLFILSIVRRVWLYTGYHGLSLARIYGMAVLLWLVGMTITMILRYFTKQRVVVYELIWTLAIFCMVMLGNAEKLVVDLPPTVNGRVDYVYLARMSEDGYLGWLRSYDYASNVITGKGLATKPILTTEDRRELLYAGVILRRLASNYHTHVMRYGSESEVKEYLRQVVQSNIVDIKNEEEVMQRIDKKDWYKLVDLSSYGYMPYHSSNSINDFSTTSYELSFYSYGDREEPEWLKGRDRLFSWSYIGSKTYDKMYREMNIKSLLTLMDEYRNLRQRIDKQPKEERSVDMDISISSPFID